MSDRSEVPSRYAPGSSRIGLFGGTFDPVHRGHIAIAEEVCRAFSLGRVEFLPARVPPHKTGRTITDIRHRLAMLEKATAGHSCFRVSREEANREGPSYLVDTLEHYHQGLPAGTSLFFLMGMDNFREISTWHDYARLFSLSHFVVISRPGYSRPRIREAVPPEVAGLFTECHGPPAYLEHPSGCRIYFHEDLVLDVSSARIREEIRQGQSPSRWVPETVLAYIRENHLYS
jgi:nicotinate-nucleotide adenylyltransferase